MQRWFSSSQCRSLHDKRPSGKDARFSLMLTLYWSISCWVDLYQVRHGLNFVSVDYAFFISRSKWLDIRLWLLISSWLTSAYIQISNMSSVIKKWSVVEIVIPSFWLYVYSVWNLDHTIWRSGCLTKYETLSMKTLLRKKSQLTSPPIMILSEWMRFTAKFMSSKTVSNWASLWVTVRGSLGEYTHKSNMAHVLKFTRTLHTMGLAIRIYLPDDTGEGFSP